MNLSVVPLSTPSDTEAFKTDVNYLIKVSLLLASLGKVLIINNIIDVIQPSVSFLQLLDFVNSAIKDGPLPWSVSLSIEKVKTNIQWRKTNEKDVENWLRDFFSKPRKNTDDGFSEPA